MRKVATSTIQIRYSSCTNLVFHILRKADVERKVSIQDPLILGLEGVNYISYNIMRMRITTSSYTWEYLLLKKPNPIRAERMVNLELPLQKICNNLTSSIQLPTLQFWPVGRCCIWQQMTCTKTHTTKVLHPILMIWHTEVFIICFSESFMVQHVWFGVNL